MLNTDDIKQISELLDTKLDPVHKELKKHGKMLQEHGKMLKQHGKLLRSLKKDQDVMLKTLDQEQMDQRKSIKRIEQHVGLSSYPS